MTGVEKLLKAESGSASAIAKRLTRYKPCSRQLVEYWVRSGYVPGKWAPFVNEEYGIPLHDLNPTVYPQQQAS